MRLDYAALLFLSCASSACGGSSAGSSPASSAPNGTAPAPAGGGGETASSSEPVKTGKDCVKAVAECGGGVCKVAIQNDCDQPVTCDAGAVATCKQSTDMIEANGRNRDTFAAHSKGSLGVTANCQQGEILRTAIKDVTCR